MYYQATHPAKGEPSTKEVFTDIMKDDDSSIAAISEWEKLNPPSKKFTRKRFMNFVEFAQQHGVRVIRANRDKEIPMEEGQYLIWKTKECGWNDASAKQACAPFGFV
jgi:hypothetical protein